MNLVELLESSKKVANWRETGYGQNTNWVLKSVIPFVGTKTILFQAECFGQTVDATHVTQIQFSGITFFDTLPEDGEHENIKEIDYKGETYYYVKPDINTQCTVRCSCPDFVYRFAWYNFKHKALFGAMPKKYKRKTKTRPPVNPGHHPGMCKHIFQLQSYLRVHDYIN